MLIKERVEELVEFYAPFLDNAKEFIIGCHRQPEPDAEVNLSSG